MKTGAVESTALPVVVSRAAEYIHRKEKKSIRCSVPRGLHATWVTVMVGWLEFFDPSESHRQLPPNAEHSLGRGCREKRSTTATQGDGSDKYQVAPPHWLVELCQIPAPNGLLTPTPTPTAMPMIKRAIMVLTSRRFRLLRPDRQLQLRRFSFAFLALAFQ